MSTSSLPSLDAIGLKFGTDKASTHHNYLNFYEGFFAEKRTAPITILEVGVWQGASLKTWEAYFPAAKVVGADIMPATRRFQRGRVAMEIVDQSNIDDLTRLAVKHGPFDIVVEDGSHIWDHQILTLKTLYPFVKPGGLYIAEDLQTNYESHRADFQGLATESCVEYLKGWMDVLVAGTAVDVAKIADPFLRTYGRSAQFMTFYRHACLIRKGMTGREAALRTHEALVPRDATARVIPVAVLAHVTEVGDVVGPDCVVDLAGDAFTFQGLSVDAPENAVECRVRFADGTWSAWQGNGLYAGTRGASKLITGFGVRTAGAARGRYGLRAHGRFAGVAAPVSVGDGEDCVAPGETALCGVQVDLVARQAG